MCSAGWVSRFTWDKPRLLRSALLWPESWKLRRGDRSPQRELRSLRMHRQSLGAWRWKKWSRPEVRDTSRTAESDPTECQAGHGRRIHSALAYKGILGNGKADEWAKLATEEPEVHGVGWLRYETGTGAALPITQAGDLRKKKWTSARRWAEDAGQAGPERAVAGSSKRLASLSTC